MKISIFIKYFLLGTLVFVLSACGSGSSGGGSGGDSSKTSGGDSGGGSSSCASGVPTLNDSDGDYIPNNIEAFLGTDQNNGDANCNGVLDGLDTEGAFGDTYFNMQWHIRNLGIATNDSGVLPVKGDDLDVIEIYHSYMGYNDGENMIVQVVDGGVDSGHEDIELDPTRSYDGGAIGDPSSIQDVAHGTEVAGIIAAKAFNGKGVRGISPFSKIAGSNWMSHQDLSDLEYVWYSGAGANEIAVSNNSWGSFINPDTAYEDIMALGTSKLRDGKGRIYVFAAGNEREERGNANLEYMLSNRYAIAVSALKADNTLAPYSDPGSNILVSGYGGNDYSDSPTISTTTIMGTSSNTGDINTKTTWSTDVNGNYTFAMNGTSAAAPTVSGSIALVLEACPDLTWRDVKHLIAKNATPVDTSNSSWVTNGAGLKHSIDYGFGLINPKAMIAECRDASFALLPTETNTSVTITPNEEIPDDGTPRIFDLNVSKNFIVEWVEVTVDNNSTWPSDYEVVLISPSKTQTELIQAKNGGSEQGYKTYSVPDWMDGGFRLGTAAMTDENSSGMWILGMRDLAPENVGTLKSVKIKIYGHQEKK